jgi:hypothetical protein
MLELVKDIDVDAPLTLKILLDPEHPVPQLLLSLYSMETYLYGTLNYSTRFGDQSKFTSLGPYAQALDWVVGGNCAERTDLNKDNFKGMSLYRGASLTED